MSLHELKKKYIELFGPIPYELVKYLDDDEQVEAFTKAIETGKPLEHNDPPGIII